MSTAWKFNVGSYIYMYYFYLFIKSGIPKFNRVCTKNYFTLDMRLQNNSDTTNYER